MIGTGKYDFPGIRKAGTVILKAALASTAWGAWLIASPFQPLLDKLIEWGLEWLANRGLVVFNIGAIYVEGVFDQRKFDNAMEEALARAKAPALTDAQKKEIDDKVIKAMRAFGSIANNK
jgi:hypothetical protein